MNYQANNPQQNPQAQNTETSPQDETPEILERDTPEASEYELDDVNPLMECYNN